MSGSSVYLAPETVSWISAIKWGMLIDPPCFKWKLIKDLRKKKISQAFSYCLLPASCRHSLSSISKYSLSTAKFVHYLWLSVVPLFKISQ